MPSGTRVAEDTDGDVRPRGQRYNIGRMSTPRRRPQQPQNREVSNYPSYCTEPMDTCQQCGFPSTVAKAPMI
jgi:hypothetical protein